MPHTQAISHDATLLYRLANNTDDSIPYTQAISHNVTLPFGQAYIIQCHAAIQTSRYHRWHDTKHSSNVTSFSSVYEANISDATQTSQTARFCTQEQLSQTSHYRSLRQYHTGAFLNASGYEIATSRPWTCIYKCITRNSELLPATKVYCKRVGRSLLWVFCRD